MIPHIIHQIWIGDKLTPKRWMDTWQEKHPDWKYILWNNEKICTFKFKNQKCIDYYAKKKLWHGVADIMRYEILYKYGGVMPEADSECLLPIDELFTEEFDAYSVYENEVDRPGLVSPLLACTLGNEFTRLLIEGIYEKEFLGTPWKTTGNLYMQQMIEKTKYPIKIFPSHYFNPVHFTGLTYSGTDKIYAKQRWGTTLRCYDKGIK